MAKLFFGGLGCHRRPCTKGMPQSSMRHLDNCGTRVAIAHAPLRVLASPNPPTPNPQIFCQFLAKLGLQGLWVGPAVSTDSFCFFCLAPHEESRGSVRTVISLGTSMVLGRFRPASGGGYSFFFLLAVRAARLGLERVATLLCGPIFSLVAGK